MSDRKPHPMRRLWFLLRVAFHDWMWEVGPCAVEPGWQRRLARRLPSYFSDPYYDPKGFARALESAEPTVGPGWVVGEPPSTFATGRTVRLEWRTTWRQP